MFLDATRALRSGYFSRKICLQNTTSVVDYTCQEIIVPSNFNLIIDALEVYLNTARDKMDDRREILRIALPFCNEFLQVKVRVFWVSNDCGDNS